MAFHVLNARGLGVLLAAAAVPGALASGLYLFPRHVERALLASDAQRIAHHWADYIADQIGLSDAVYHDRTQEHAASMHAGSDRDRARTGPEPAASRPQLAGSALAAHQTDGKRGGRHGHADRMLGGSRAFVSAT